MPCPFCELIARAQVRMDGGAAVAIADAFPLNPGHMLVLPRRHEPDFLALRPEELEAVANVARALVRDLKGEAHPDGFNLGVNVGPAAGQTIDHAHLHVIPVTLATSRSLVAASDGSSRRALRTGPQSRSSVVGRGADLYDEVFG